MGGANHGNIIRDFHWGEIKRLKLTLASEGFAENCFLIVLEIPWEPWGIYCFFFFFCMILVVPQADPNLGGGLQGHLNGDAVRYEQGTEV